MAIITFKVGISTFINQPPCAFQYLNIILLAAVFTDPDFFRPTFIVNYNILKHHHFFISNENRKENQRSSHRLSDQPLGVNLSTKKYNR